MNKKKLMFLTIATVFAMGIGTIIISGLHQVERIKTIATEPYSCDLPAGYTEIEDVSYKAYQDASDHSITNPYTFRGTITRRFDDFAFVQRKNSTTGKIDAIKVAGLDTYADEVAVGNVVDISGGTLEVIYNTPTVTLTQDIQLTVAFAVNPMGYEPLEYQGIIDYYNNGLETSTCSGNEEYAFYRSVQLVGVVADYYDRYSVDFGDETYYYGVIKDILSPDSNLNFFTPADDVIADAIESKINQAVSGDKLINIKGIMYYHQYFGILIQSAADIEVTNQSSFDTSVISSRETMYIKWGVDNKAQITSYTLLGKGDVPYVEFEEFVDMRNQLIFGQRNQRKLSRQVFNGYVRYTSGEYYGYFDVNAGNDTIYLYDNNGSLNNNMTRANGARYYITGSPGNIQVDSTNSRVLTQRTVDATYNLGQFNIDIVCDSYYNCYVPLTTLGDIVYTTQGYGMGFNGKNYYFTDLFDDDLQNEYYTDTPWAEQTTRSTYMAEYTYNALLFSLKYCYGLETIRGLTDPDAKMKELGVEDLIKSTNNDDYEVGMATFAGKWLFEGHAGYTAVSPLARETYTEQQIKDTYYSYMYANDRGVQLFGTRSALTELRTEAGKSVGLTTYGNTAIIRFDEFVKYNGNPASFTNEQILSYDYETLHAKGSELLFRKAFLEIEGDPTIENVVIDLSLNGGGAINVVPWLEAYMTPNPSLAFHYKETGEKNEIFYRVDINYDGKYDDNDAYYANNYNFYCLTSNFSFSCGNFLPTIIKGRGLATLFGEASGGGVCAVGAIVTASGTILRNSSLYQLGTVVNDEFMCSETGIEPDYAFDRANYYDDEAINAFVNAHQPN